MLAIILVIIQLTFFVVPQITLALDQKDTMPDPYLPVENVTQTDDEAAGKTDLSQKPGFKTPVSGKENNSYQACLDSDLVKDFTLNQEVFAIALCYPMSFVLDKLSQFSIFIENLLKGNIV